MKNTVAVNLFNARVQTVGRPGSSLTFNASGTKCAMTAGIGPAANAMPNVGPTINNAMRNAKNQKVVRVQHVSRWMTTERGLFGETRTDSINIGAPHVIDHGPENINSPDRSLYMSAMGCLAENSASKDYNCSWISGDAIFVVRAALGPAMVAASNSSSLNDQTFWEYSRWEHWHLDQSIGTSKTNFYVAWSSRHRHVYFLERAIFPFVVRHDTHYHAQYDWDVRHVCTVEYGCGWWWWCHGLFRQFCVRHE
tara:strand:- start:17 stop:772 length:756 start_codon:yes stop_codon:yes gene_type:complete